MHSQLALLFSLLAANTVTALPLNINLGAYSPALVVGDGEISFGGKADVTSLMNALEGAAVSGAAANGQAAPATPAAAAAPAAQPAPATQAQVETVPAVEGQQTAQIASLQGMGKEIAPRVVTMEENGNVVKRDINGFNAALKFATGALTTSPGVELGTGEGGSGVGIKQGAGGAKPAAAAAAPAAQAPAAAKREENAAPKLKTTVTTMFVRGGPAPAGMSPTKLIP